MHNYNFLNEAYFGKNKNVLKIEKCIGNVRTKYKDEFIKIDVESSTEWQDLKKSFEDAFGFYSVTLILDRSSIPNAYTTPITMTIENFNDISTKVKLGKFSGLKFKPEHKLCTLIVVTEGMMFNDELTDAEITAILLHEVGHNFDAVGYSHLVPLSLIGIIFNFISLLDPIDLNLINIIFIKSIVANKLASAFGTSNIIRQNSYNTLNKLQQTPIWLVIDLLSKAITVPLDIGAKILMPFLKILSGILGTQIAIFSAIATMFTLYSGYAREQFADKFPVMMGYGPEFTSGMSKLESAINNIGLMYIINRIPIIGHLFMFLCCSLMYLGKCVDPHPEYAARIQSCINMLEHDLNDKRIDPKAKKVIKEDLKKIKKNMDEYLSHPISYGDEVANNYQKLLLKHFPGFGDIRSSILKNDGIDDNTINTNFSKLNKVKEEAYLKGFNDMIEYFIEEVGEQDYAKGDGKMTRRHLPEVKKIPKQKSNYNPKWG